MRIFKLSPADEEMTNRDAVVRFFTKTLWKRSPRGRFGLTPAKARMDGIAAGTLILFTYKTECMFLGRAGGDIQSTADRGFPGYVPIDMASVAPVSGDLEDFQRALKKKGIHDREIVHTQSWPRLSEAAAAFTERYFDYSGQQRFVFVRIGWRQFYRGITTDDDGPVGGGSYNNDKTGFEVYNFLPLDGRCYGYFQPHMRTHQTALERIEEGASMESVLDKVTVIWVAKKPDHGQVIIGWWRNASIYRGLGPRVRGRPRNFAKYRVVARTKDSLLLPVVSRAFDIPRSAGGFGQTNVCYPMNSDGSRKAAQWMFRARVYTQGYDGDNVVVDPAVNGLETAVSELETAQSGRGGQGFRTNFADRKAIEDHGMSAATRYYEKQGYEVEDVSKNHPYDLLCTRKGKVLHVEVKATTTDGGKVFLTHREATKAASEQGNKALFILHSVKLADGKASGGKRRLHEPWHLDWDDTTPTIYSYRVPPVSATQ